MTDAPPTRAEAERILDLLGGDAHVETVSERQELLRFARSAPTYQHSEERLTVRIRLVRDGRSAWGTSTSLEDAPLRALRGRLEALLERVPPSGAGLPRDVSGEPAGERPETRFASTEDADADARAELLEAVGAQLPEGAELGGSIADGVVHHGVASSTGIFRAETRTRSALQLIASSDGRSSYAKLVHRDRDALLSELPEAFDRLREGLAPLPLRAVEPGAYRAFLSPQALAGVVAPFAYAVFNGRAVARGESAASRGEPLASARVHLVDDALAPEGLSASFDAEGLPKRRVPLLEAGTPVGSVHDTASARETGAASTGHAVPPAWRFGAGPSPSHVLVAAGAESDEQLLAACGTGIAIQRVDYLRVVHPAATLASGLTRDATLWLEGGRPVARLPQFRFTVRLADVLRAVEAVGARRERSEAVFMESVVAPAAVVSAFPVEALTGT